jgi:hypothetical protein
VITRGIREFAGRDWESARRSKEAYWGERIARLGPAEAFRIAEELRREVLLLHPAWPSPAQRSAAHASGGYSTFSTSTGCTSVARRAGTTAAAKATVRASTTAPKMIAGAVLSTPNNIA